MNRGSSVYNSLTIIFIALTVVVFLCALLMIVHVVPVPGGFSPRSQNAPTLLVMPTDTATVPPTATPIPTETPIPSPTPLPTQTPLPTFAPPPTTAPDNGQPGGNPPGNGQGAATPIGFPTGSVATPTVSGT
jgi:hypothetical protein